MVLEEDRVLSAERDFRDGDDLAFDLADARPEVDFGHVLKPGALRHPESLTRFLTFSGAPQATQLVAFGGLWPHTSHRQCAAADPCRLQ